MDPAETSRRIAYVRNDFALSTAFETRWVLPATWDRPEFIQAAGVHYPLGIARPVRSDTRDGRDIVFACAEVLVAQTAALTEDEFFAYSTVLRTHLHLHMLREAEGLGGAPLEAAVMEWQRASLEHAPIYDRVMAQVVR